MKIQVFDPPMCCSTGICGPSVNSALIRFAADVEWLGDQGVEVQRFNLAQQPDAFAKSVVVNAMLAAEGPSCLPIVVVDDEVVCKGTYPGRAMLAAWARLGSPQEPRAFSQAGCCGGNLPGRRGSGCC